MLAKRISIKNPSKGSFAGLVTYITSSKDNKHRLEDVRITNFNERIQSLVESDLALAISDAQVTGNNTQDQNRRSKDDKTYHLLVSFRAGEHPSPQVLKEIEEAYAEALGFGEHQRVSAVHGDTDNLHIHIAFNKIHPTKYTIKTPKNDNWILDQVREELEKKYNLIRDNHIKDKQQTKTQSQSKAADMEAHTGQQSFLGFMEENLKEPLKTAKDWQEFHQHLEDHDITLKPRGNGFIFESQDGTKLKASSLGREFSKAKLEAKYGAFADFNPANSVQQAKTSSKDAQPDPQAQSRQNASSSSQSSQPKASTAKPSKQKKTYQKKPLPLDMDADTKALLEAFEKEKDTIKARQDALRTAHSQRIEDLRRESAVWRQSIDTALQREFQAIYKENKEVMQKAGLPKETWTDWKERQVREGNEAVIKALSSKRTSDIYQKYQEERSKIFEERKRLKADLEGKITNQKQRSSKIKRDLNKRIKEEFKKASTAYQQEKAQSGDLKQKYADWLQEKAAQGDSKAQASILAKERSKLSGKLLPLWKDQADKVKLDKQTILQEQKDKIAKVREANKIAREILGKKKKVKDGKKAAYAELKADQEKEIEKIRTETKDKLNKLGDGGLSWADWLRKEAENNNQDALEILRGRKSSLIKRAERYGVESEANSGIDLAKRKDVILTKSGTLLVKVGAETIRDDGKHLTINEKSSDEALLFAISAAAKRDGKHLNLTGKPDFQERIVKLSAKEGLDVSFANPALEKLRQDEIQKQAQSTQQKGNLNGQSGTGKDARGNHGGIGRHVRGGSGKRRGAERAGGVGGAGRASRANVRARRARREFSNSVRSFADTIRQYAFSFYHRAGISKSGIDESWGSSFTAKRGDSVRNVSIWDVADNSQSANKRDNGTALPLPVSTGSGLGKGSGRSEASSGVRWEGKQPENLEKTTDGAGVLNKKSAADFLDKKIPLQKYIAERNEKKGRGIIAESYEALKEQTGFFTYEGIRKKDGQSMVLLKGKDKDKIFVRGIDKKTENRLRQIKKGQKIEIQKGGKLITQPKSKVKNRNEGR